jgi:predicted ATP-dependent endonuclease of OLD family
VLNEYDCNGYFLDTNNFEVQIGLTREQMPLNILLKQKDDNYITSFDNLSSGEKTLITLSLLIYKSRKKRIIPRILLLDEIDSSLHPSMIKRLLNVIQEIFIKRLGLKVILATHSPTTVALSPIDSIYLITKNEKDKIMKQNKDIAINILTEGFAVLNTENSNLSIEYNISQTNLPVLFTEGITDKIIIETAWKKLNGSTTTMPFYIQDCFDASFLCNFFKRGEDGIDGLFVNYSEKTLIALFDFDEKGYNAWNSLNKFSENIEIDPRKTMTRKYPNKKIYAILLPVPENEIIKKQVIIKDMETYRHDSVLEIELLFFGVEELGKYFIKKPTKGGGEIIIFQGEKRDFSKAVGHLKPEQFFNFKPLFHKLQELIGS